MDKKLERENEGGFKGKVQRKRGRRTVKRYSMSGEIMKVEKGASSR